MFRISKTRPANEVTQRDLFDNFYPNSYLQGDFLEYNGQDFMLIVCTLTGYGQIYITRKKGKEEANPVMKSWIAQYGRPLSLRLDSGLAFRDQFSETIAKMGVKVQHSSAYSPQSNSVANWQESIKKRHQIREKRILKPQSGSKDKFDLGERCMLQCLATKKWDTGAMVVGIRVAPDQKILSYCLGVTSKKK